MEGVNAPRSQNFNLPPEELPQLSQEDINLLTLIKNVNQDTRFVNVDESARVMSNIMRLQYNLLRAYKCSNRNPNDFQVARQSLNTLNGELIDRGLKNKDLSEDTKRKFLTCAVDAATTPGADLTDRFNYWFKNFRLFGAKSAYGYVISAQFPDNNEPKPIFVIKVPQKGDKMDDFLNETTAGVVAINRLKSLIPNFVYTYGYMYCGFVNVNNTPVSLCNQPGNVPYLIIENLGPNDTLYDMALNVNRVYTDMQVNNCILQILNALAFAQEKLGFTHYDLHSQNVLVTRTTPTYIPFILGDNKNRNDTYLLAQEFMATLIDFGLSSYEYNGVRLGRYAGYGNIGIGVGMSAIYDIHRILFSVYSAVGYSRRNIASAILLTMDTFYANFKAKCRYNRINTYAIDRLTFENQGAFPSRDLILVEQKAYSMGIETPYTIYKQVFDLFLQNTPGLQSFLVNRQNVDKNFVYNYDNAALPAESSAAIFGGNLQATRPIVPSTVPVATQPAPLATQTRIITAQSPLVPQKTIRPPAQEKKAIINPPPKLRNLSMIAQRRANAEAIRRQEEEEERRLISELRLEEEIQEHAIVIDSSQEALQYIKNTINQYGTGPEAIAKINLMTYDMESGVNTLFTKADKFNKELKSFFEKVNISVAKALPYLEENKNKFRNDPNQSLLKTMKQIHEIASEFRPHITKMNDISAEISVMLELSKYVKQSVPSVIDKLKKLSDFNKIAVPAYRQEFSNAVNTFRNISREYIRVANANEIQQQYIDRFRQLIDADLAGLN